MTQALRIEAARAELDGLGLKHYLDVRATIRQLLQYLPRLPRTAFAAAVAERVVRDDERRPVPERPAYLSTWRPVLDQVWRALAGAITLRTMASVVARCYVDPQFAGHPHDDPTDAADHAVMATLYAAECYLHGCLDFATWAGWRGFDAATVRAAADQRWPHRRPVGMSPYAWELAHPDIQSELDRQLDDLERLNAHEGTLPQALLDELRLGWGSTDGDLTLPG
jgi:hypothetical protein